MDKKNIIILYSIFQFFSYNIKGQGYLKNYDSLLLARKDVNMDSLIAVPNEKTAIAIAKAIWLPIYGKSIKREKPYIAYLNRDDIWVVNGTFHGLRFGGVAYAFIRKKDGKIIYVIHGQ